MNNLQQTTWQSIAAALVTLLIGVFSINSAAQTMSSDFDGDGINNLSDNCSLAPNQFQIDADNDGYGNHCDADLNNDGVINFLDYAAFTQLFLSDDAVADLNVDGVVNFLDLAIVTESFFASPGPSGVALSGYTLSGVQVYQNVALGKILHMKQAPGKPGRWYALQRQGKVVSFLQDDATTELVEVLNIQGLVDTNFEGGALGLAFDPDFTDNGFLYISYTTTGPDIFTPLTSRVSRFNTSMMQGVAIADPLSEVIMIFTDQPYANHNGGDLAFGHDGYLYWGLGDGGSFGDPQRNGQNTGTWLGSMLRLDVDVTQKDIDLGVTYKIPATNPFAVNTDCTVACPEIFAWGLRNPFRFSFDRQTGELWAGDVGQNAIEEVDVIALGQNYGWRCYEGLQIYNTNLCDLTQPFSEPVHTYTHAVGNSITGGNVYRGGAYPDLQGLYIYGDFSSGTIWGLYGSDPTTPLISTNALIVAFTEDSSGELYYIDLGVGANARVFRLEASN